MKPLQAHARPTTRAAALATAALALLLGAGCASAPDQASAPGPAAQATGLAPQAARITDERIVSDRRTLEAVQQRLRALSEAGVPQSDYALAKAQCWLDSAKAQYHENDRTGYVEESLAESMKLVAQLEADRSASARRVGWDTPHVARSTRLREDLWGRIGALKQSPALACGAQALACAEVRLVRAGHAEQQTGWRAAVAHVAMVEDAVARAQAQQASCPQAQAQAQAPAQGALSARAAPPPPAAAAAPPPAPAPAPVVRTVTRETFVVLTDTLFAFDKSAQSDMLAAGAARLRELAQRLKAYQSIESMTITGHTDRLGSDAYNQRLSEQRAASVRDFLHSLGVKVNSVTLNARGERDALPDSCSDSLPRPALIACLQPQRRVTIEVSGSVK